MFRVEESTYHSITSEWNEVKEMELGFVKDWAAVIAGFTYFSILNEKNGKIQGAFCLYSSKRKGMEHISNPPYFQSCSLVLNNAKQNAYDKQSLTKRALEALSKFLNTFNWVNVSLPHIFKDTQPFIWDGFSVAPRYTYLLDISRDRKELALNFSKGFKNDLSNIAKSEVSYSSELTEEIKEFLAVTSASHRAESEQKIWNSIIKSNDGTSNVCLTTARFKNWKGVSYIIKVGKCGIYMFGNSDKSSTIALNTASLMVSIDELKAEGVTVLDFEGSMIPGIERYFRSFGGELTPYYNIVKEPKLIRTAKFLKG